jgi:hypothetical protein
MLGGITVASVIEVGASQFLGLESSVCPIEIDAKPKQNPSTPIQVVFRRIIAFIVSHISGFSQLDLSKMLRIRSFADFFAFH